MEGRENNAEVKAVGDNAVAEAERGGDVRRSVRMARKRADEVA